MAKIAEADEKDVDNAVKAAKKALPEWVKIGGFERAKYLYALARQIVSHRHITVNGELVNIPSYHLKPGDKVAVREKSKSLESIERSLANSSNVYEWITCNNDTKEGTFVSVPARL